MYGRIGPSWARATVDGWRSRAWRRARCSETCAAPPRARAGSSTPSPSWCARATVESDANWHKLASIPSLPSELQERIFTSRRVTANTERGEASVASSRQRATERDPRAFGAPRASAEAVVANAGVCARRRRPPNAALTGALQPARFSWNRERARRGGRHEHTRAQASHARLQEVAEGPARGHQRHSHGGQHHGTRPHPPSPRRADSSDL